MKRHIHNETMIELNLPYWDVQYLLERLEEDMELEQHDYTGGLEECPEYKLRERIVNQVYG